MIVYSIPSLWGEEKILGAAPGSRDAWYGFRDAKLSMCVPENPVVVLLFFSLLDDLQSHQRHQAAPGFSKDTQPPTAEMCLIFSVLMMLLPVLSRFF